MSNNGGKTLLNRDETPPQAWRTAGQNIVSVPVMIEFQLLTALVPFSLWADAMPNEPIATALRHLIETRRLVESLVTSSESFDYPKAKLALRALDRKVRELAKLQAEYEKTVKPVTAANVCFVDFSRSASASRNSRAP